MAADVAADTGPGLHRAEGLPQGAGGAGECRRSRSLWNSWCGRADPHVVICMLPPDFQPALARAADRRRRALCRARATPGRWPELDGAAQEKGSPFCPRWAWTPGST
ncbi:MAG: hypothetical protein MZU95_02490 [Desulfomicrobium escambiense]|nr:hypothetical protein [Desulfomicrobium escambiense]